MQALAGKSALRNSLGAPGEFYHNPFPGFIAGAHGIEIGNNNCSALGIKQFLDQIQKEGPKYLGMLNIDGVMIHQKNIPELLEKYQCQNTQEVAEKIYQMTLSGKPISIMCLEPDNIEERVLWIINSYNMAIKEAGDEESRLKVIVEHVQLLEQFHPFPDVNNRTFVGLILQKLLIENGFTPVTLWNYNIFDLYSRDEIIAKLKEGMNHTRNIVAGKPALDFDSKTLSKESEASLASHTAPLHAKEAVKANPHFAYIDLLQQFGTDLFKKVEAFEKKENKLLHEKNDLIAPIMIQFGNEAEKKPTKEERAALYKQMLTEISDPELRAICENLAPSLEAEPFNIQRFYRQIQGALGAKYANPEVEEKLKRRIPVNMEIYQGLRACIYKNAPLDEVKKLLSQPELEFEKELYPQLLAGLV